MQEMWIQQKNNLRTYQPDNTIQYDNNEKHFNDRMHCMDRFRL